MNGAQRFAVQLARLLARVEAERWCMPAEACGVALSAAALVAVSQRPDDLDAARARELFLQEAGRLFDAAQAQHAAGRPLVELVPG